MFRLGGPSADGVGITSGFNRRRYGDGEFGEGITKSIEEITAKPKFGTDELISEMYRTVGGASDWKDWIKQGSDRALEIQDERKLKPAADLKTLLDAHSKLYNKFIEQKNPNEDILKGCQWMTVHVPSFEITTD